MKYDVFISYSSKDKEIADFLCKKIEESDLKCWIAPRNETAGMSYARQILQAINDSSVVLVCFSKYANSSAHVESEIDNAFGAGKVIIPFRIDNCEMSAELKYYLNKKHWLNGIPINDKAVSDLIASIIANIPERAKAQEVERSVDNALGVITQLFEDSKDKEKVSKYLKDKKVNDLLEKFETLNETYDTIKENISKAQGIRRYEMLQNKAGEILIITGKQLGEPDTPRLVYDGGDQALLYINKINAKMLNSIAEQAREPLMNAEKVQIVEIEDNEVVCEYNAKVLHVRSLKALANE